MDLVHQEIPDLLAEDLTELELEGTLVGLARAGGHQGVIRARGFNMEYSWAICSAEEAAWCTPTWLRPPAV